MNKQNELIERVRELDKAATDGPWEYDEINDSLIVANNKQSTICDVYWYGNQELIVEYRTLCPQLADQLEAEQETIDKYEVELKRIALGGYSGASFIALEALKDNKP